MTVTTVTASRRPRRRGRSAAETQPSRRRASVETTHRPLTRYQRLLASRKSNFPPGWQPVMNRYPVRSTSYWRRVGEIVKNARVQKPLWNSSEMLCVTETPATGVCAWWNDELAAPPTGKCVMIRPRGRCNSQVFEASKSSQMTSGISSYK